MAKKNMWFLGGIIVIVAVVAALALTHKSNKPTTTPSYTSTASQPYSSTSNSSSTTPSSSSSAGIVTTKTDPSAGEYLAASNGKPLYTYGGDTSGVSNCTGACLVNWPIYGPVSSSASLPTNVTVITRSDGKAQYAYKGMPLYYFSSDSSTPTGDGVSNFHLAKP